MTNSHTHRVIILIGPPGSGKSACGAILAARLQRLFLDTDAMIEEEAGLTIPEIFSRFGESHFRKLEQRIIDRLISPDTQPAEPLVVATGGGMPVAGDNLAKLKQLGTLVYLFADLQTLSSRTASTARPLVNADASTHQERLSQLEKLVASRNPAYRQADHHVDTTGREPGQVAELIIKILLA